MDPLSKKPTLELVDDTLEALGHRTTLKWFAQKKHRSIQQWRDNLDANGQPRDVRHRTVWQWLTAQEGTRVSQQP